ncbi:hypothetical protein KK101_04200 [Curtobacterium flaccumfaciens pv. oortii]|uniref:hypothetical protein n=1 Tax=Curtobacterium flaccumfaciens TaxID=2035 RepID=UPI001BDE3ED0|nr:hypothetical protein [Curtobacterium flaccumfaciens]MBT1621882.1 hypothetical protein [Curtobacterium flaccumfaciens pv. oortii]
MDTAFQTPTDRIGSKRAAVQSDADVSEDSVTLSYEPLGPVTEPSTGESGLDADD